MYIVHSTAAGIIDSVSQRNNTRSTVNNFNKLIKVYWWNHIIIFITVTVKYLLKLHS